MSSAMGTLSSSFNPRSREGSDYGNGKFARADFVSIHAPVKGATRKPKTEVINDAVSIHAPVKGATSIFCIAACWALCFNPRSREGSDDDLCARGG